MPPIPRPSAILDRCRQTIGERNDRAQWIGSLIARMEYIDDQLFIRSNGRALGYLVEERRALAWSIIELAAIYPQYFEGEENHAPKSSSNLGG
jgi:hypothetical protein